MNIIYPVAIARYNLVFQFCGIDNYPCKFRKLDYHAIRDHVKQNNKVSKESE
jgi:hypothetical protein